MPTKDKKIGKLKIDNNTFNFQQYTVHRTPTNGKQPRLIGVELEIARDLSAINWETFLEELKINVEIPIKESEIYNCRIDTKSDSSIRPDGAEITVGPLSILSQLYFWKEIYKNVATTSGLIFNKSCGLHIHLDATYVEQQIKKYIPRTMSKHNKEDTIYFLINMLLSNPSTSPKTISGRSILSHTKAGFINVRERRAVLSEDYELTEEDRNEIDFNGSLGFSWLYNTHHKHHTKYAPFRITENTYEFRCFSPGNFYTFYYSILYCQSVVDFIIHYFKNRRHYNSLSFIDKEFQLYFEIDFLKLLNNKFMHWRKYFTRYEKTGMLRDMRNFVEVFGIRNTKSTRLGKYKNIQYTYTTLEEMEYKRNLLNSTKRKKKAVLPRDFARGPIETQLSELSSRRREPIPFEHVLHESNWDNIRDNRIGNANNYIPENEVEDVYTFVGDDNYLETHSE